MSASVRGSASSNTLGGNTAIVPIPAGIQDGDLLISAAMLSKTTAWFLDASWATKGWWSLNGGQVNTRQWKVFARVYNSADPVSTYELDLNDFSSGTLLSVAVQDHAVSSATDLVVGTYWRRSVDGGGASGLIRAPGVAAPENSLVLALTGEATTSVGGYTATVPAGFTRITEHIENASAIEWVTAWQRIVSSAETTSQFELTYVPTSTNGVGLQIAVPSAGEVPPEPTNTGRIGAHIVTSVGHDRLTIGFDRLGGTEVAVALNGGTPVTAVADTDSGWGHVTFTGLIADTEYMAVFFVDGVEQTDVALVGHTFPTPGAPTSFTMVTGSCQFTGSNHPVWDRIREDSPRVLAHMGDLHYGDATTESAWRTAVESSLTAPRMKALLEQTPLHWAWDNHDRIITNVGGAGTPLNLGTTDQATNVAWRKMAGVDGWASADTVGRTWVIGRVRFIQTDNWTAKSDPDAGVTPRTFLGAAQKQWFKDTLEAATEPVIVWLCQWTGQEHANGRWMSFPEETQELEAFINARPAIKAKIVMIGGDSHSLQVTDGSRTTAQGQRFAGIPNYNISGFNRTGTSGVGTPGWLVDQPLRTSAQPEADWGGYSRVTVTDDGQMLTFHWEGVRVGPTGATDIMYEQTLTFGSTGWQIEDTTTGERLTPIYWDGSTETVLEIDGA